MKFKKALAGILSVAMVVTLMPATAFASSTNTVSKVSTVSEDEVLPEVSLDFEVRDSSGWSTLDQTITLNLDGAEWENGDNIRQTYIGGKGVIGDGRGTPSTVVDATFASDTAGSHYPISDSDMVEITAGDRYKAKSVQITLSLSEALYKGDTITLTFPSGALKATGSSGDDIVLSIDEQSSNFTGGDYTIAHISGGGTTTTVSGTVKSYTYQNGIKAAEVRVREDSVNSLSSGLQLLKLTLPKEVKWNSALFDDISGAFIEPTSYTEYSSNTSNSDMLSNGPGSYYTTNDGRVLVVCVDTSYNDSSIQNAYFTPLIDIKKKAAEGDITLTVQSLLAEFGNKIDTASGLTIAIYGEEKVSVTSLDDDDLPTIVAGQITDTDDEYFWTMFTIKESVGGALTRGRDITVELPSEVQVVTSAQGYSGADPRFSFKKEDGLKEADKGENLSVLNLDYNDGPNIDEDTSEFSFEAPDTGDSARGKTWKGNEGNTMIVFIPVTVKANFSGDIVATISGKDFSDTEVTLGKVVAPLNLSTSVTNVVNGAQNQALATITLTESEPGYIGKNTKADKIILKLDTKGIKYGYALDNAKAEVTDGDLEIDEDVEYDYEKDEPGTMVITVKNDSTDASTIEITGVTIDLARSLAEGQYNLGILALDEDYYTAAGEVKEDAVVENALFNDGVFGGDKEVVIGSTPYINITTASDTDQQSMISTFVIGETTYTVNGKEETMDVAPYIDSANRTMLPIRFVANALGIDDDSISYGSGTATISGRGNVVTVTTGSQVLGCSNGDIKMDTVAVNSNNRLYVPVRFIAQALGASVSWDQATQTVTLYSASK